MKKSKVAKVFDSEETARANLPKDSKTPRRVYCVTDAASGETAYIPEVSRQSAAGLFALHVLNVSVEPCGHKSNAAKKEALELVRQLANENPEKLEEAMQLLKTAAV